MPTHLARYVRRAREARDISPQALAARIGYRNVNKGANRILLLEREGRGTLDFLAKVVAALELNRETVDALSQLDDREDQLAFEEWASVPVAPRFVLTPLLAIQLDEPLPGHVRNDEAAALAFASATAKAQEMRAALIWSRRVTHWIRADGTSFRSETTRGAPNEPHTRLKNGRRVRF